MARRTIQVPLHLEGISTPSENPDAGYKYIYFKSDGILYCKDENGNEGVLGGGGGASSMILALTNSNGPYIDTTSATYETIGKMIYGGSNVVGLMQAINVNAWITGTGSGDLRVQDITNGNTVAEVFGLSSTGENIITNMGTLSNIPTTASILELQARKVTGGGNAKVRVSTLEITY